MANVACVSTTSTCASRLPFFASGQLVGVLPSDSGEGRSAEIFRSGMTRAVDSVMSELFTSTGEG